MWDIIKQLLGMGVSVSIPLGSFHDEAKSVLLTREKIVSFALSQVGKPYRLGAENTDGAAREWDCSELVEIACKEAGEKVPDGSGAQYAFCIPVTNPSVGDLGFLWKYGEPGTIGHVEILSDSLHTIGAVGISPHCVRVEKREWLETHPRFAGWRRHPNL